MKRLVILALVALLTLGASALTLAAPGVDAPDWVYGAGIFANYTPFKTLFLAEAKTGLEHKTIVNARVSGSASDILYEQGNQDLTVLLKAIANIPCYLELELIGNAGYTKVASIGPNSTGTVNRTDESLWMLFDTNYGGFINEDWESVNVSVTGFNPEELYIQACDIWTANMKANIGYGLEVRATPLGNSDYPDYLLPVQMRANLGSSWTGMYPITEADAVFGPYNALEENTVYMQFRVPYGYVPAGAYEGVVAFRMYSI